MPFCFGARRRQRFAGYTIAINAGDGQSGTVGTALSTALSVVVRAPGGALASGVTVLWSDPGDGTVTESSQTNGSGVASATWTLGIFAGTQLVTATVAGGGSLTFTATATADAASQISAVSVLTQAGSVSTPVSVDPSVLVRDVYGNPKSGVSVTWAVASGGGSVDTTGGATTDSDGLATVASWTLGGSVGTNTLTATVAGLTGSPITFTASAAAAAPASLVVTAGGTQTGVVAGQPASPITFQVRDSGATPLVGVTVSLAQNGGGSLSASSAVSDASGNVSVTLTTHTTIETATVTATCPDGAGGTITGSTTVASTFGTATALNIVTEPAASGASGTALSQQPIIEVTDANGNRVTSSTATVTATLATGNGSITAGSSAVASSGLATFSGFTINDADGGTSTVLFSSSGLTGDTSQAITIAPPVPAKLGIGQQPSAVNTAISIVPVPTVLIQDSDGNTIAGATNAVTVALGDNGEGATLSGTLTVNAVNGTASFPGLSVDVAGSYTLNYTSGSLTGVNSTAFTVSSVGANPNEPGSMTQLSNQPWNAVPSVGVVDAFGWRRNTSGSQTIATDASAPVSPSNVLRINWNTGLNGGTGPVQIEYPISGTSRKRLYLHWQHYVDPNWTNNGNSETKWIFFCQHHNKNHFIEMIRGATGTGNMFRVRTQHNNSPSQNQELNTTFNATAGHKGVWLDVEVHLFANTAGTANGVAQVWVDGTSILNRSDVLYFLTGEPAYWNTVYIAGTYGGGSNRPPQQLYCLVDNMYVSAANS